jgi:hypothetical protein
MADTSKAKQMGLKTLAYRLEKLKYLTVRAGMTIAETLRYCRARRLAAEQE